MNYSNKIKKKIDLSSDEIAKKVYILSFKISNQIDLSLDKIANKNNLQLYYTTGFNFEHSILMIDEYDKVFLRVDVNPMTGKIEKVVTEGLSQYKVGKIVKQIDKILKKFRTKT